MKTVINNVEYTLEKKPYGLTKSFLKYPHSYKPTEWVIERDGKRSRRVYRQVGSTKCVVSFNGELFEVKIYE